MSVLVLGGTGTVGSQVVRELVAKKVPVRVLTRSEEKAAKLPKGADPVIGDLLKPETIKTIFKGADGVLLLNTVSSTECTEGLLAVNGAVMGHVRRVVYISVQNADKAPHLPHFGAKLPIEMALARSGLGWTVLRPNNFYQNDHWFREAIQNGIYPQPIGDVGLSRVDVRDVADAAVAAFVASGREHEGQVYNLVGPDVWTGASTAEAWSKALGKPVNYAGNDLEAWEQQQLAWGLDPVITFDFKLMYKFFQEQGLLAGGNDIERLGRVLGHAPRSYGAFVEEAVMSWK